MSGDPPLHDFLQLVDTVFWVVEPAHTLAYVSPAFERIWGRPVEEVVGPIERFLGTIHPDDRDALVAWVAEGTEARDRRATEYRIVRPNGEVRWIRTRAFPAESDAAPERFVGVSDDITAERSRARALERTTRRLQKTFESLQEAVFIVDTPSRVIVECNAAACEMFGYARDELLGAATRILHVSDETAREFGEASVAVLEEKGVYRAEFRMRRRDGTVFETVHTVSLLDPLRGKEDGVVSVVRDISLRRGLERRLQRAQRLEALGRLAGGVAHDFNNLLTVIQGNLELARREGGGSPAVDEILGEIGEAARRGMQVTAQLLAFGRRQPLTSAPVDLRSVLEEGEGILRRVVGEEVELQIERGAEPAVLDVDRTGLEQAILNLAINARQAMPHGGRLSLVVRTEERLSPADRLRFPEADSGPHVLLEVSDTGVGMSPEIQARAFEPFFTTRGREGGTGLGLSSVYGTVAQSGGSIAAESEPGRGATFTLCFPASSATPPTGVREERLPEQKSSGRGETILLVEDDPGVRRALVRVLEGAGYRVLPAGSAEEARGLLSERGEEVRLCLTDVVLPGASGVSLAAHLRQEWPDIPVLAMTGYTEERLSTGGAEAGNLPFLQKPFLPAELTTRVRELLDGSRDR